MPKGYIIAMVTINDSQAYEPYIQKTPELVSEYGGSYLVRGGSKTVVEGEKIVGESPLIAPGETFSYNSYHVTHLPAEAFGSFHGVDELKIKSIFE